ncbi:very short patch repair endonuclease [Patescibacteria group bacterium]|nr:very short patch repair endonuclease [Patescibacteria group bacterium]MCG2702328.1 very short patch repair endonuclease [Candidatus Parcubacteria bacterium]MBU4209915.1 very short patch repair endonuclease [Patescibacteria group bacterium]MBU4264982.1 very short patch repair endonuclease [Patescibacteria group bacterium]MBU4389819.1 very short patch repair endonuclease [Patescibacteria group bacterium]
MDKFSKKKRSEIMSKVKEKDSQIEIVLRKALWKKGIRYRKNVKKNFGNPDLVLAKYKTVIFVDSCFWHGCPKHYRAPSTKIIFWKKKLEQNKKRDKEVNLHYKKTNWQIIRIWEHEIKRSLKTVVLKIIKKLNDQ